MVKNAALGYKMHHKKGYVGGPILIKKDNHYQIVGIHINGIKGLSCGLQFDEQIRNDINYWLGCT